MIGLDTNVILRYLAQDDAVQSPVATRIIHALTPAQPGFLSTVCIIEVVWVMQSAYKAPKQRIIQILDLLLRTPELHIEDAAAMTSALRIFQKSRADFADCLIACIAKDAGCAHTLTFDLMASTIPGMSVAR